MYRSISILAKTKLISENNGTGYGEKVPAKHIPESYVLNVYSPLELIAPQENCERHNRAE